MFVKETIRMRKKREEAPLKVVRLSSHVSIPTGSDTLPIEITVTAKLAPGTGSYLVENALNGQSKHPNFIDEFNEPSALIGRTSFEHNDPTAIYTFGVDTRDLVFHRHEGHRVITGFTGGKGCHLKFSVCSREEALADPDKFLENLKIVEIPGDRVFVLRFSGTVYHQFCPADRSENGFFAVSVHTNEAGGLSGELLEIVLANDGNIPLLTEPAPDAALEMMDDFTAMKSAVRMRLDID